MTLNLWMSLQETSQQMSSVSKIFDLKKYQVHKSFTIVFSQQQCAEMKVVCGAQTLT